MSLSRPLRALLLAALACCTTAAALAAETKVLRYAFPVAETGFDPVQVSDLYSRIITAHIFEPPLGYDHLARPFKLRPSTAAAMPEVSDDFRRCSRSLQRARLSTSSPPT